MKPKLHDFIHRHPYIFGALTLAVFTLLIYGNVVFGPSNIIISHSGNDISLGIHNVDFTFSHLARGEFPLWNPHMMGGYPWFASFQTLMLYPPAWMFLVLSVGTAVNTFVALHVFLIGFAVFCWLKQQDLHPFSCILGGAILMFCAQVTMQIYSGAVTPLATMPWMVLLLLAVDGCFDAKNRLRWILAGAAFVALQIMAGFPQHVYYTALIIGLYLLGKILLATSIVWKERLKVLFSVAIFYIWGATLCAIQLMTSFDAATETARQGKLPFEFAGSYSFPPWNLFTLISPFIFGDDKHVNYWGRSSIWEMLLYVGVVALVLATVGLFFGKHKSRFLYLGIGTVTALTAFGYYTPLFTVLYNYVPGFGSFRANFRILFQCSVFLAALAAIGFDALLRSSPDDEVQRKSRSIASVAAVLILGATVATYLQSLPNHLSWFKSVMQTALNSQIQRMEPRFYSDIPNVLAIANNTSLQLAITAITLIITALLLYNLKTNCRAIYYIGVLAIVEIMVFTLNMRPTFPLSETQHPAYINFLKKYPSDARFIQFKLNTWANGLPLSLSGGDIGGYESFRLRRYDSFIQFATGESPNSIKSVNRIDEPNPAFSLLRGKYVFDDETVTTLPYDALPHLLLVSQWKNMCNGERVLLHLKHPGFNPRQTVLLESTPHFPRSSGSVTHKNHVTLVDQSANWLDIKATVTTKTMLLVTDTYAKDWKVFPYDDSAQQEYDVMPADYVLRGIPLSPGTHHFRVQYAPDAFYRGRTVSIIALLTYLLACCGLLGASRRMKNKTRIKIDNQ